VVRPRERGYRRGVKRPKEDDAAPLPNPSKEPRIIAGRYRLGEQIGEGGMGEVYAADDLRFRSKVAVKLASPAGAARRTSRARFEREARIGNRLGRLTGFVRAFDWGVLAEGRGLYLAMDLVSDARSLDVLSGPVLQRLERVLAAARLVAKAHAQGVVHRDLKPGNILQGPDGEIQLADFGIARLIGEEDDEHSAALTLTGDGLGTPAYMAPEQMENARDVDGSADVYSLGVMMFQALTNEFPYPPTDFRQLWVAQERVRRGEVPPPRPGDRVACLDAFDSLCASALALDPEDRVNIATLIGGLEAALASVGEAEERAQADPDPERARDPVALLRERLRAGELTLEHIEFAARLGHAAARELCPGVELVGWRMSFDRSFDENQTWIWPELGAEVAAYMAARVPPSSAVREATALLGDETLAACVAADWAESVLRLFKGPYTKDTSAREAIDAARRWAASPCEKYRRRAAAAANGVSTDALDHTANAAAEVDEGEDEDEDAEASVDLDEGEDEDAEASVDLDEGEDEDDDDDDAEASVDLDEDEDEDAEASVDLDEGDEVDEDEDAEASVDLDEGEDEDDDDDELNDQERSMCAARAAEAAAIAASSWGPSEAAEAAEAAAAEAAAATDVHITYLGVKADCSEREWQRLRLAAYLLGEVETDEPAF
jgi:hypothetical protein